MSGIAFTISGPPKGKGRPKFTRRGKPYTPKPTALYELDVSREARRARAGAPMLAGPLRARIVAYFPIPKKVSKANKAAMLSGAIRPRLIDTDNIAKIILDGAQRVAFANDVDIAQLSVAKLYAERPRVEVVFEPLGDAP